MQEFILADQFFCLVSTNISPVTPYPLEMTQVSYLKYNDQKQIWRPVQTWHHPSHMTKYTNQSTINNDSKHPHEHESILKVRKTKHSHHNQSWVI